MWFGYLLANISLNRDLYILRRSGCISFLSLKPFHLNPHSACLVHPVCKQLLVYY